MIRPAFLVLCLGLSAGATHAFDMDDCIINGVKGVSTDLGAKMVRMACERKLAEAVRQKVELRTREYGEPLDPLSLEKGKYYKEVAAGIQSMQYTNKNKDKTVTYFRLEVTPASGGQDDLCLAKSHVHA